jgi:hypothetical protein
MTSDVKSDVSTEVEVNKPQSPSWWKLALLTTGSAFAGGIAVAWWYRKTLTKLHESGENLKNPDFGISSTSSDEGL